MRLLLGVLIVQLVLLSAWQRPSRPVYHAITAMRTSANPRRNTLIALPATVSSSLPSNNIASKGMQSLTSDQGVQKLMLKAGNSKKLESGDILAVKYSLRLKDSSKVIAKGDEARFTFQDGTMIKGWDIALDSMKVGEQASFVIGSSYAYGEKGLGNGDIVPTNANLQLDIEVLAWLGNILQPETLFQKDLDIDPFVASTPETIQKEFEERQAKKVDDKYQGSIVDIYLRRLKNISFGFAGVGFFTSQSGERPPWYLNPNLTFPGMILFVIVGFATVFSVGGVREKGIRPSDLDVSAVYQRMDRNHEDQTKV